MADRLLDTNALSAAMRGDPAMARYLQGLGGARLSTSVVAQGEIRFGILRLPSGRRRRALARAFVRVLSTLHDLLPITRPVARHYARLKSSAWSAGAAPGENDLWIAATAVASGLVLVTRDAGLAAVPGLDVEDWSKPWGP